VNPYDLKPEAIKATDQIIIGGAENAGVENAEVKLSARSCRRGKFGSNRQMSK